MWKSKKQFLIFLTEGVGAVFISALPVHIAQIGHGTGPAFPIVNVFPERRGSGQSLQEKLVRADRVGKMFLNPGFVLCYAAGQSIGDTEPVWPFAEFDAGALQTIDAQQALEQSEDVICRFSQK